MSHTTTEAPAGNVALTPAIAPEHTASHLPPGFSQLQSGEVVPVEPESWVEAGVSRAELEALIFKFLFSAGTSTGRAIAEQIRLPFRIVKELLRDYKSQLLLAYRSNAPMNDYECELTDAGVQRARRHFKRCTYFGAAPVPLKQYLDSVRMQSIRAARPRLADLRRAFDDLLMPNAVVSQIGQALNAGRGLFLFGAPGNGKSSIAERLIRSVDNCIWIPRTITVTDEIIRLYDPIQHQEVPLDDEESLGFSQRIDKRWVRIRRPAVISGGELQLDQLDVTFNPTTGINEAPLQLKANGGAMIIDDFGRQRVSDVDLLNRWIVPLERGHDYLTLPSGRQVQSPFDCLLVLATNIDPKKLVDEAFLRRIPYKVEVLGPTPEVFRTLLCQLATEFGFRYEPQAIDYLIDRHYLKTNRPMRFCHPRDLLQQVKNLCEFHEYPLELTPQALDIAVHNYFAGL